MCASLLIAGALFFVLSPGVLLTIPPGRGGLFCSGQTSLLAALVHAVVFVAISYLLTTVVERFVSSSKGKKLGTTNCCAGQPDGTKACDAGCGSTGVCQNGQYIPDGQGGLCQ